MQIKNNDCNHECFMRVALKQANKAYGLDEVPIGAIIVDPNGKIIGRGYNLTETKKTQLAHAELNAIKQATKKIGDWRLDGCTIYITLEPCCMCFYAIALSRCATIVYGASSPLFGFALDSTGGDRIYKKHIEKIVSGVCREESANLLKSFFKGQRGERNEWCGKKDKC
jgi:tRNA(adenine34) deaminase